MISRSALGHRVAATVRPAAIFVATLTLCVACTSEPIDPDDPFLSSTTSVVE